MTRFQVNAIDLNLAFLMFKVKKGLVLHYIFEIFYTTSRGYNLMNPRFNEPRFLLTISCGKHSLRYTPNRPGEIDPERFQTKRYEERHDTSHRGV